MPSTPKHRHINRQPQPFEIKQIKENYWWPANCLKTNDKTAACLQFSCEDWRLRDTPQGDWHLPHAHTNTHSFTVYRESIYSWQGAAFMWEIRAPSWLKAVFSDWVLTAGSVTAPVLIQPSPCVFTLLPPLHPLICTSLLNFSSASVCSGYRPAVPHHQVPDVEVVPQWDDDEEGIQGSEVGGGHCWLHPPAAGRPRERNALKGGG